MSRPSAWFYFGTRCAMRFELNEFHRNISNEDLINDVLRVKMIYGKDTLTRAEYKVYGKYGANTFCRHFGGWNKVLCVCGMQVTDRQEAGAKGSHYYTHVTDEQLVSDLLRVAHVIGKNSFSSQDYQKHGRWSRCTYLRRFETWNNALKCAGLQPSKQYSTRKIDNGKILEEIERLWVKLGRQPTATDIKNGESIYSLNTFSRHFGSWRNALSAFMEYVNGKDDHDLSKGEIPTAPSHSTPLLSPNLSPINLNETPEPIQKHKTLREPNLRLRFKVLQRDQFKCCSCGASPAKDPKVELHIDHIKPWSMGGETELDNLQTLCSKCNYGKSDMR